MKKLLVFIPLLFAVGCKSEKTPTPVSTHTPQFEKVKILSVKSPKHFRLKYQVLSTGQIYTVGAKRCSSWRAAKVGEYYQADINRKGCSFTKSLKKV